MLEKVPDNNRRPRRLSFSFMLDLPISQITDVKKHGSYNLQISIKREKINLQMIFIDFTYKIWILGYVFVTFFALCRISDGL